MPLALTPAQTIGPFFHHALPWRDGPYVVAEGTAGRLWVEGRIFDAEGAPVGDALVETWQADPHGRFAHPDDPRSGQRTAHFRGFGRCPSDPEGRFFVVTLRPGRVPGPEGRLQAPHLDVGIFARGLLSRVVTRIYLSDETEANAEDPVLAGLEQPLRTTLVGEVDGDVLRHDIHLGGPHETVFFEL
ncbi:MAG: protocatechuate 3,4-dioxygenase subunit alpha [Actinomycetota bacterium]|nr:protocatechuate 3,4-dioxygenase subunit alpha [Actinomycetota bacterium]